MVRAAGALLALMLIAAILGMVPVVMAQGPSDSPNFVIRTEKAVPIVGTGWEDSCGVTFEFLPDGRMICGELKGGKVRLIENGTLVQEPLIELDVEWGYKGPGIPDEQGLIGLAVDPNFEENGYVYVHYTYLFNATSNETMKKLARYTMVENHLVDEKVLFDNIPGAKQHVGGPIEFGPDGKLYVTGGEAGKRTWADDLRTDDPRGYLGKILRLNPDGTIPSDNPYPGEPFYTIGHRNVFGITFHPVTGRPYITENGNTTNDEINILYAGKNYGWPNVNGTTNDPRYVSPLYATGPGTIAPTEAEFYVGDKYPEDFNNDLFFLAFNTRSLERIDLVGPDYDIMTSYTSYPLPNTFPGSYTDIELGPDGYFYVSDFKSILRVYFDEVNATSNIVATLPAGAETAQTTTLSAKIVDGSDHPLAGVLLSFLAAGNVIGTAETNVDGIASVQYTPLSAGDITISAKFAGNEKYAPSASAEVVLKVEGPSTLPPQILEALTQDNFVVRLTILPSSDQGLNSTMNFAVSILDPRSQATLTGIPYHIDIIRDNSVLFSKDEVTGTSPAFREYIFQELGPARIIVKDVNNSESSAAFNINVVPEFPLFAALVPIVGFAFAIIALRYGKISSSAASYR
jgi:glucose/arabinose dehydrogenase